MPLFLQDTFTATAGTALQDHVGEVGATWTRHPINASGSIVITDANRARANAAGASGSLFYSSAVPNIARYYVESELYCASKPASGYTGVAARIDTTASTFYWAIYNFATSAWELRRTVTGTGTLLGSFSQSLTIGQSYTLRLRCFGSTITLFVDGVSRVSVTDGGGISAAGRAGLFTFGAWSDTVGLHHSNIEAQIASFMNGVGDSVAAGSNATTTENQYRSLVAANYGATVFGTPVGSTQIVDQVTSDGAGRNQVFFTTGYSPDDYWTWMAGYNDMRYHGTNATALETFARCLRAAVAWISRMPDQCKQTSHADWSFTGTWSTSTQANLATRFSSTASDSATVTVDGTAVTLCYMGRWGLGDGATVNVTIDGTSVGSIDTNLGISSGYGGGSPTRFALMAVRFAGLSAGAHTVQITIASAGVAQLAFVCGTGTATTPDVRLSGPLKMASAGYSSSSPYNQGSDAAVALYAAAVESIAAEAAADGRKVRYIDINDYWTISNMDTDLVHPTNAGHVQLADAFIAAEQPLIESITPNATSAAVVWDRLADEYRINNGTATALPDGTSPDTITGLTVNTEYNAPGSQLRFEEGEWSAAVAFGTLNPASGEAEAEALLASVTIAATGAHVGTAAFTATPQAAGVAVAASGAHQAAAAASVTVADPPSDEVGAIVAAAGAHVGTASASASARFIAAFAALGAHVGTAAAAVQVSGESAAVVRSAPPRGNGPMQPRRPRNLSTSIR